MVRSKKSNHTKFNAIIKIIKNCIKAGLNNLRDLYWWYERKKIILYFLAIVAVILGLIGFAVSKKTDGVLDVVNNTIALFAFSYPLDDNCFLDFAKSFAILTVFFGVITLFSFKILNYFVVKSVQQKPFDLIIGLGSQNEALLNSRMNQKTTLIVEADESNPSVHTFRRKGFGVIVSRAEQSLHNLDLGNLKCCIISVGSDRRNITLAIKLIELVEAETKCEIHVRVDNRDLSVLFKQEVVYGGQAKNIDIIPFSLDEIVSKQLFSEHSVLGLQTEIIQSDDPWSIAVVGTSNLAAEIIYQLAADSHLPEQNCLTIYCVHQKSDAFCDMLEKRFPGIHKIPHLTLIAKDLDSERLSFFTDALWRSKRLTNIIIATDDEDKNLDIAVNLQDTTYIHETTAEEAFGTKILFAIHNSEGLGRKINDNKKAFANFYSFGDLEGVSTWDNLIDEKLDTIAKLIHYDYKGKLGDGDDIEKNVIDQMWIKNASLNDRESCRAQATHIDIKLLALGLKKQKLLSPQTLSGLLLSNQKQFDKKLVGRTVTDSMLADYRSEYFPDSFDNTQYDKLARAEHNRWNAFHYLRGWQHSKTKNKAAKLHDCLAPLEKFESDSTKLLYQYDILSVLSIPKYLAHAGYEIVELPE